MLLAVFPFDSKADEYAPRCIDRAAIERVYHSHRIGTTRSFEDLMPPPLIEQLVKLDEAKESALRTIYHLDVTPEMLAAEVLRIQTTTRAPEVLAEIKHALGDDAKRFANAMARPLIVERELHRHFDYDNKIHAAQRHAADLARTDLLSGKPVAEMHEVTWLLTPRPADDRPSSPPTQAIPTQGNGKSITYTIEATAQVAQAIDAPANASPGSDKLYFDDLDPELQHVLRVQLQKPGDVSAVIEAPGNFLIFQAKAISSESLAVSSIIFSKRTYEAWLSDPTQP